MLPQYMVLSVSFVLFVRQKNISTKEIAQRWKLVQRWKWFKDGNSSKIEMFKDGNLFKDENCHCSKMEIAMNLQIIDLSPY